MAGKQIWLLDDGEWPTSAFEVKLPISLDRAVLGIIDMQHYCISAQEHAAHTVQVHSQELYDEYMKRVNQAIENIVLLLSVFRNLKHRVFFTRFGRVFGYVMKTSAIVDWLKTGIEPSETKIKAI